MEEIWAGALWHRTATLGACCRGHIGSELRTVPFLLRLPKHINFSVHSPHNLAAVVAQAPKAGSAQSSNDPNINLAF